MYRNIILGWGEKVLEGGLYTKADFIGIIRGGKYLLRNRLLLVIILTLCLAFTSAGYCFAAVFLDLENHWAENEIAIWAQKGLTKGYNDGTFKPNQQVTRAEFVCLINRAFNIGSESVVRGFNDVSPNKWYYQDVIAAESNGYISGYADDTFRPNQAITRQEVASVLAKLLKLEQTNSAENFKDANEFPEWARSSISAVVNNGLMLGTPDGKFNSSNNITRAEAVVSLERSLQFFNNQQLVKSNVEGTITFRDQELKDVTIRVFKADDYKLLKEEQVTNGHFKLDLEPGNYDITAITDEEIAYLDDISIVEHKTTTVDLTLEETAVVCGTLEDKYGNAVKDAVLTFSTNPTFITTTDDKGEFSLSVLPNRTYKVCVFKPGNETGEPDAVYNDFVVGAAGQTYTLSLKTPFAVGDRKSSHHHHDDNDDNNDDDDNDSDNGDDNDNDGDNDGDNDEDNDGDEPSPKELDLQIVKVKGNTKNDKGNMLTVVVGGNDLSKVMDQFKQAREEYFKDKVAPQDSLTQDYYTTIEELNRKLLGEEVFNIKIQGAPAFRCSFEDEDLDKALDILNIQINKELIELQKAKEDGLTLSFNYEGRLVEILGRLGEMNEDHDDVPKLDEDQTQNQEETGIDTVLVDENQDVSDVIDDLNVEVINIKGNIMNDSGKMLTVVIGGSKDSDSGIGMFLEDIENLKIEGKGITKPSFEDLDFDLEPDVFNARISKGSIWNDLAEDAKGDKLITVSLNYKDKQVNIKRYLTTGGGCTGERDDHEGGCENESGEDHSDEEGECGGDHSDKEGDCGGESGEAPAITSAMSTSAQQLKAPIVTENDTASKDTSDTVAEESKETASKDTSDTVVEESKETANEDTSDTVAEESKETANEDTSNTVVEESKEASNEDTSDTVVEESKEAANEDTSDTVAEESKEASNEDTSNTVVEESKDTANEDTSDTVVEESKETANEDTSDTLDEETNDTLDENTSDTTNENTDITKVVESDANSTN